MTLAAHCRLISEAASTALKAPDAGDRTSALRIIEELARQLRAPMKFDAARHAYTIEFATIPAPNFS